MKVQNVSILKLYYANIGVAQLKTTKSQKQRIQKKRSVGEIIKKTQIQYIDEKVNTAEKEIYTDTYKKPNRKSIL